MLFDIATTGKYYNYEDWAVEIVLGPGRMNPFSRDQKVWYQAEEKAREKLFELFIKE